MAKRISVSLCLLAGVIVAGVPAQAAITTAQTLSQPPLTAKHGTVKTVLLMAAEQLAPTPATLTLEDLPPGFTELPPELATMLASRLEMLKQELGQGNMKPENFFAFVNPKNFQIVLGFTGKLPNQSEQTSFDASLDKVKQPDVQQQTLSVLQEKLKSFGEIKVTEYRPIPDLNNLANASTGMTLGIEMQGQPLRLDLAAFRRNATGALTGIMYATGEQPLVGVGDLARKLDQRIEQFSANTTPAPGETSRIRFTPPSQKPNASPNTGVR
ncbi:hypothetical protein H6F96_16250 [Microcoleus sp. FACHB-53]|nr:hypothetical protein [Microcoleus sp. FACHB-53]MBD2128721.1 hypothetical protein [Microcoleus sp. FACHB-1]